MLALMLRLNGKNLERYSFKIGRKVTIGRRSSNDIVIENLSVSGQHAKIELKAQGYYITDLDSTNGTFVNGKRVTHLWLNNDDVISIGKYELVVSTEDKGRPAEIDVGKMDSTVIMDAESYRAMLEEKATEVFSRSAKDGPGILTPLTGAQNQVVLENNLVSIGKSAESDIVARGLFVGKTAATISKRADGYFLSYAGGRVKPRINGKIINKSVRLNEGDMLKIGSLKMQFSQEP